MKKNLLFVLGTFALTNVVIAQEVQTGINTKTPKATLDVAASPTNATQIDGLIAPRLTGNELKAKDALYTADQLGAIVYAKSAANPTTAKTVNVTEEGYYYFDGTVWVKIGAGAAGTYQEPWYDVATNQPATENTQNIYQMGRVGIRTNDPKGALYILNDNLPGTTEDDIIVSSYSINGDAKSMLLLHNARGTHAAPQNSQNGDPIGAISFRGRVNDANIALSSIESYYKGDGISKLSNLIFATNNIRRAIIDENGNMGVGTETPITKLDVRGAIRGGTPHGQETGGTSAIGQNSIAVGNLNKASGQYSIALGAENISSGKQSAAVGYKNEATGDSSFAANTGTKATNFHASAFGYQTQAMGNASFAQGAWSQASGSNSSAFGVGAVAKGWGHMAVGNWNVDYTGTPNSSSGPIFQVGNGGSETQKSNAFTVNYSGLVGINTATPNASLHVVKTTKQGATNKTVVILEDLPVFATEAAALNSSQLPSGGVFKVTGSNVLYIKP